MSPSALPTTVIRTHPEAAHLQPDFAVFMTRLWDNLDAARADSAVDIQMIDPLLDEYFSRNPETIMNLQKWTRAALAVLHERAKPTLPDPQELPLERVRRNYLMMGWSAAMNYRDRKEQGVALPRMLSGFQSPAQLAREFGTFVHDNEKTYVEFDDIEHELHPLSLSVPRYGMKLPVPGVDPTFEASFHYHYVAGFQEAGLRKNMEEKTQESQLGDVQNDQPNAPPLMVAPPVLPSWIPKHEFDYLYNLLRSVDSTD